MANSAMPHKLKVTTMVQEVIRRCRNVSSGVKEEEEEVKEELGKFCAKRSGYGEAMRREVLVSGLKGFEGVLV